ncbi:prepilin peptidase [Hoyosella rhizosphaerae]|uniref:Prepilin peptidase n=1 Tax=Hoyosella rhizosphaerae TaxID=1755582 RepID=A0A916U5A7_9ACTN|nr:A24 family peptidase [Hoyosella rhizosphaerae]MBN4926445.1 prepilin peptidase [Hoyosella rhizosphaerae]GGC59312.1 prepilin peptidase [Hoyosella rhizosphaerae]
MGWVTLAAIPWMVALTFYDFRYRRLPNWLTLPGAFAIVVASAIAGHGWAAIIGGAALAAVYLVPHLVSSRGMGAGDVKLAVGIGALTGAYGPAVWFLAAATAPLVTVLCGLVLMAKSRWGNAARKRGRIRLPHGPSLCGTALAAIALAYASGLA